MFLKSFVVLTSFKSSMLLQDYRLTITEYLKNMAFHKYLTYLHIFVSNTYGVDVSMYSKFIHNYNKIYKVSLRSLQFTSDP